MKTKFTQKTLDNPKIFYYTLKKIYKEKRIG